MSTPALSGDPSARAGRQGATSAAVRQHNLAALLERLHRGGPASRSQLGSGTGLSRSSVADLVQELVTRGLVVEEGQTARPGPLAGPCRAVSKRAPATPNPPAPPQGDASNVRNRRKRP